MRETKGMMGRSLTMAALMKVVPYGFPLRNVQSSNFMHITKVRFSDNEYVIYPPHDNYVLIAITI